MRRMWESCLVGVILTCSFGCGGEVVTTAHAEGSPSLNTVPGTSIKRSTNKVFQGALAQLASPAHYDQAYVSMPYPNGDVPATQGACTDVVIRALRRAGYDLQRLIHEDMKKNWSKYPRRGKKPDSNIDHRRVPNQVFFFSRFGKRLPLAVDPEGLKQWKPGDIVTWKIGGRLDHTGIISDRKGPRGLPFVIHNISRTAEEDVLDRWQIVGHFRFPK